MLKTKTLIAFCFVVAIFITLNASANTQNQNFKGEVLGAIAPGNAHTIASLPSSDNNDNFTSSQNIPTDELESAINVKDGELVGDDSFAARLSSNETYLNFKTNRETIIG